jgi:polyisoprenoid-binding protein YceI
LIFITIPQLALNQPLSKVNSDIFLKGHLTIKNITKIIELDAAFLGINNYDGVNKAAFEVVGHINRKDFGLTYNTPNRRSCSRTAY